MTPNDQLSDQEINKLLAEFCGKCPIITPAHPEGIIPQWNPLHDHNSMAEVEAKLRELGIDYFVAYSPNKMTHTSYVNYDKSDKGADGWQVDEDKLRAFARAVCEMIRGKE